MSTSPPSTRGSSPESPDKTTPFSSFSQGSKILDLNTAFSITDIPPPPVLHRHATSRRLFIGPTPKNWTTKKSKKWLGKSRKISTSGNSFTADPDLIVPPNVEGIALISETSRPENVDATKLVDISPSQEQLKDSKRPSVHMEKSEDTGFVTANTHFQPSSSVATPSHPVESDTDSEEFDGNFSDLPNLESDADLDDTASLSRLEDNKKAIQADRFLKKDSISKSVSMPVIPKLIRHTPPLSEPERNTIAAPTSKKDNSPFTRTQSTVSNAFSTTSIPIVTPQPKTIDKNNANVIIHRDVMLVRKEITDSRHGLPQQYNEWTARKMKRQSVDWREFEVVLKASGIEFYTSGFGISTRRLDHQIIFSKYSHLHLSFYSSLDHTIALIVDNPKQLISSIFIFKASTLTLCTEWYMLLWRVLPPAPERAILPWCDVHIPDIDVRIRIPLPDEGILTNETNVTANAVKNTVLEALDGEPEWAELLERWRNEGEFGLCWKRFDRLEWIAWEGSLDGKGRSDFIIGPQWLEQTHILELRSLVHALDYVPLPDGTKFFEPPPVEGYLIRLTNRYGRTIKPSASPKRHYYTTHENYLFFISPLRAIPPDSADRFPENKQPIIYSVTPHVQDEVSKKDLQRRAKLILSSTGLIDLTNVVEVRPSISGWTQAPDEDSNDGEGSETLEGRVWADLDPQQRDLEAKTFEIVLKSGMNIKLRAYNPETMKEWVRRLNDLVNYWKLRLQVDLKARIDVEKANANKLYLVDEEQEGMKDEYGDHLDYNDNLTARVDPYIWNFCCYTGCRNIAKAGPMYKKLSIHSVFTKSIFILTRDARLLMYRFLTRKDVLGTPVESTYHNLELTLNLANCYVYSGRPTFEDLTYTSQSDSNDAFAPAGYTHIPRLYSDGLVTNDDDESCSFSIFKPRRREFYSRIRKRMVTFHAGLNLGSRGNVFVFRARNRQEKEEWVMTINTVIERFLREEKAEAHLREWRKKT